MISSSHSRVYLVTWVFTVVICFVNPLKNSSKSPPVETSFLNSDTSHEDVHSSKVNSSDTLKHLDVGNQTTKHSVTVDAHKPTKKIFINTDKLPTSSSTLLKKVIATEGGSLPLDRNLKNKTAPDNNTKTSGNYTKTSDNSTKLVSVPVTHILSDVKTSSISPHLLLHGSVTLPSKRIHHGPPIFEPETSSPKTVYNSTNTTTPKIRKKKPLYTFVPSDEDAKGNDSFIESSTTGRDYVLTIVLIILVLPLIAFIIKLIYRRGTEFTERQQYHRMYLIDGMYNSR